MDFLLSTEISIPSDLSAADRDRLLQAERARSRELAEAGLIQRVWRVPGRYASWALWRAEDASALHSAVCSLPLWPFMDVTVHPLADHPSDPDRDRQGTPPPTTRART